MNCDGDDDIVVECVCVCVCHTDSTENPVQVYLEVWVSEPYFR